MSNRKTVNTLKTGSRSRKDKNRKSTGITFDSILNQTKKTIEKSPQFIARFYKRYQNDAFKQVVVKLRSAIGNLIKNISHMYSSDSTSRTYLFQELETNSFVQLIKTNRKVALASLSTVLAFLVGFSSLAFYVVPNSPNALTQKELPNTDKVAVLEANEAATINPEHSSNSIPKESTLSRYSGFLKYGPLFESERMCFVLRVDGKPIAYFRSRAEGQTLLDTLLSETDQEDKKVIEVGFAEKVDISSEMISMYQFEGYSDPTAVERFVRTGTLEKKIYSVQNGDVLSTIAEKHGMSLSQLYSANPGIESKKYLQIGDELNLVVPTPIVNVKSVIRVTYSNAIPYETTKVTSKTLYKGETTVKTKGSTGEMKVEAEITKVNGQEVKRVILNEKIVKQPVGRVLAVGTKEAPPTVGSGKFSKPVSRGYTVSSPFGRRWGSFHTGIDLAMSTGSPVYASDGGTVVFAGRQSSYGKLVVIDHGGNLQSYYAHNSKLLVSKGDKVFKGEKIALSGSTGRSTGPHLHFEIRYNGVPKNPTKYVHF